MKLLRLASLLGGTAFIVASAATSVPAQDRPSGRADTSPPIGREQVLTQPVLPAPENGDIILGFGDTQRLYFKHSIKSVKIEDESAVKIVPQTDHVMAFTGLYPGKTFISIEGANGKESRFGVVTVTHHLHEVKVYVPPKRQTRINAQIVVQNGETQESKEATGAAGYYSILCNEVGCRDIPK